MAWTETQTQAAQGDQRQPLYWVLNGENTRLLLEENTGQTSASCTLSPAITQGATLPGGQNTEQ